jgi:hypothetical protein
MCPPAEVFWPGAEAGPLIEPFPFEGGRKEEHAFDADRR